MKRAQVFVLNLFFSCHLLGQKADSSVAKNNVFIEAESGEAERNTSFHATASIGYRYQKQTGGLYIRVVYSPIYENYNRLRHWGGLSLGSAF